jgi:hypothetical protein
MPRPNVPVVALAVLLLHLPALACNAEGVESLADFSIEDLSRVTVHSVSRLADAPAAVVLITGNDLCRSSATTLPEALRLTLNRLDQPAVSAYTELNVRMAWQVSRQRELALSGRNLLQAGQVKYGNAPGVSRVVARSVLAIANDRF